MSTQLPAISLERLRRDAKSLRKEKGIKHSQALELVARNTGFRDWHHAQKTLQSSRLVHRVSVEDFDALVRDEKLLGSIQDGRGWVRDPVTGMRFHKSIKADLKLARELRVLHNLFIAAHPDTPIWQYEEREKRKEQGRQAALNRALSIDERLAGVDMLIGAWYSRSVEAWLHMGFSRLHEHPGFPEYARHLWTSTRRDPEFPFRKSDFFWGELKISLDAKYPLVPADDCRIGIGKSYWDSSDRKLPVPQSGSAPRGVTFSTPLGKNPKFRPARRMPIESHIEAALNLKTAIKASQFRDGVKNRLGLVRSDLDDWVQKEYSRADLTDDLFFELYYNGETTEIPGLPAKILTQSQYVLLSAMIDRVAALATEHYEDCKPRRRVIADLVAARLSLDKWLKRSWSELDEKVYLALKDWAGIYTWFTSHPADERRFNDSMQDLYSAAGGNVSKDVIRSALKRHREENPEGLGGKPSDERLERHVEKVRAALSDIQAERWQG